MFIPKKVQKTIRKFPKSTRCKLDVLIDDLKKYHISDLRGKWKIEKMLYDKEIFRAKIDYSHRLAFTFEKGQVIILDCNTREKFVYHGGN